MKGQCTLVKFLSIFDEFCDILAEFRKTYVFYVSQGADYPVTNVKSVRFMRER